MNLTSLPESVPAQSRLGWLLRIPLRLLPKSVVVRVRSGINRGYKWIVGSSTHGCWLGTYEIEKQSVVSNFIKPGMVVFDIGANAGFYTLAFSRFVGHLGKVYAFEPLANKVAYLLKHIHINLLTNVKVIQAAVAENNGLSGMQVTDDDSMGTLSDVANYLVPTVALDILIANGTVPEPDAIKMDVEGAESKVLEGAVQLLRQRRVLLFIACHGHEQRQRCLEILRTEGYRVFYLDGEEHTEGQLNNDEIYALPENM